MSAAARARVTRQCAARSTAGGRHSRAGARPEASRRAWPTRRAGASSVRWYGRSPERAHVRRSGAGPGSAMPATRPEHSVPRASDAANGFHAELHSPSRARTGGNGKTRTSTPIARARATSGPSDAAINPRRHDGRCSNRPVMTSSSAVSAPPIRPVGFRKRTLTANVAAR